jgi:hypothetical protein
VSYAFNGSTSIIEAASQAAAMNDALGIFVLAKIEETTDATWESFVEFHITEGTVRCGFGRRSNGLLYFVNTGGPIDAVTANDSDGWCRYWLVRSAAAATEMGKAVIGTTTPTTGDPGAQADGLTAAGGPVFIGGPSDPFDGKMAAVAWWEGTPPTSAQLAACVSTADLLALSPSHCYDAGGDSNMVTDLVGSLTLTPTDLTSSGDNPTWGYEGGVDPVTINVESLYSAG